MSGSGRDVANSWLATNSPCCLPCTGEMTAGRGSMWTCLAGDGDTSALPAAARVPREGEAGRCHLNLRSYSDSSGGGGGSFLATSPKQERRKEGVGGTVADKKSDVNLRKSAEKDVCA